MKKNDIPAQQFVHAMDHITDAVVIISPQGFVSFINDKFISFFPGREKHELMNQNIKFLVCYIVERIHDSETRSRPALQRFICNKISSSTAISVDFQKQDGRHVKYTDQGLADGSRVGIFSDESAISALHKQFETACDEAEKLSQAKSAFMAAMSHEVKTPLNAIISMLDLCSLDDYIGNNEYIQRIQKNADNLLGLINNVLDFTKIEANKVTLSPTSCNIRTLCENIIESFSASALKQHTQLTLFVDPRLPTEIEVDDIRLRQVLNNLISNGLKFTNASHPKLSLFIRYHQHEKRIECCVQDNGIGISEEQQKYIFAGFEQASTDIHRKFGGTGLGLSICQKISWLMNGSLKVDSVLNKGTKFTFSFPCIESSIAESPALPNLQDKLILCNDPSLFKCLNLYRPFFRFQTRFCAELPEPLNDNEFICVSPSNSANYQDWLEQLSHDSRKRVSQIGNASSDTRPKSDIYSLSSMPLRLGELLDFLSSEQTQAFSKASSNTSSNKQQHGVAQDPDTFFFDDMTALVVEDNKDNMFVFERQLQRLNVSADFVLSPDEAITRFKEQNYDVVLSDFQMPQQNGAQLIRRLRAIEQLQHRHACQMFIVTADKTQSCFDDCLAAGANEVVMKPLTLSSLSSLFETAQFLLRDIHETKVPASQSRDDIIYQIDVLKDILGSVSEQELKDFMAQYLINFATATDSLSAAISQADWKKVGGLAHSLKSSSLIIGAQGLSRVCVELENACNEGASAQKEHSVHTIWPAVQTQITTLRDALRLNYE